MTTHDTHLTRGQLVRSSITDSYKKRGGVVKNDEKNITRQQKKTRTMHQHELTTLQLQCNTYRKQLVIVIVVYHSGHFSPVVEAVTVNMLHSEIVRKRKRNEQ